LAKINRQAILARNTFAFSPLRLAKPDFQMFGQLSSRLPKIKSVVATLFLLALSGLPPNVSAEFIPPWKVSVHTERYRPEHVGFPQGTYDYDIAWEGIPVASGRISVESQKQTSEPVLKVTAECWSARGIRWLYNLNHRTESLFNAVSLRPIRLFTTQVENSRENTAVVDFSPEGKISSRRWKNGKSNGEDDFSVENPIFDPITATFLARSLPVDVGKEVAFDVYNGKHRYLISLNVEARETIKTAEGPRDALRVRPTVKKLTDSEGEKKLKSATLWVSADENREVLRLESKVWVGSVTAKLKRFTPAPENVQPTVDAVRAQLASPVDENKNN